MLLPGFLSAGSSSQVPVLCGRMPPAHPALLHTVCQDFFCEANARLDASKRFVPFREYWQIDTATVLPEATGEVQVPPNAQKLGALDSS